MQKPKLAVLISFSGSGGVEASFVNLLAEFVNYPIEIDLLLIKEQGPFVDSIPKQLNRTKFKASSAILCIPELTTYLKNNHPDALLVAKDRAARAAIIAKKLSGSKTPITVSLGTNLSASFQNKSKLQRWFRTAPMQMFYKHVNKVIGVSQGVCDDLVKVAQIPSTKTITIDNPVITPKMLELAQQPLDFQWLKDSRYKVIIGVGRLGEQKDFKTLINAFSIGYKTHPGLRLVILGEGKYRQQLELQVAALQISESVYFAGFVENPFKWIGKADVFALSSRWEGSGNVLTEAMALGIPVVSTDCPSGPSKMLQGGKLGTLVPIGDHVALSKAIIDTLNNALPPNTLKNGVKSYWASESAKHHLQALNLIN